ncbi:MAG: GSCFA domain-containing protein [Chitinophagaceae bacterium]|nr:GSCFA domain-containing protein [Chitinophagaceae bacterium]
MMLDIDLRGPLEKIDYRDKILLTGSCFTEHIGDSLKDLKFQILQNPNGIIFDPSTVSSSITSYIENKKYTREDLIYLNELWQSWQHHGRFSGVDADVVLDKINRSQQQAHYFLKEAKWLIITLGTSFSYRLREPAMPVANCHRAPGGWFNKYLMTIEETIIALDTCLYRLYQFNPGVNIIFTVSPVRHIRDGIIDNNRSKARLLEAVHHLVNKFGKLYYFPSYELVIDVLRDYRFYDIDLVHPNYQATRYVIEQFMEHYVNERSGALSKEIEKINIARKHKPFHPATAAHRQFLKLHAERTKGLMEEHPFLQLHEELEYFGQGHA